jgi:hypothetical protein
MAQAQVSVVGMAALRRDLNRLATDERGPLYAAISAAGRAAVEPVAAAARASLPQSGMKATRWHRPGALAASVRASGTRTGAAVRYGRAAVNYAGWMEFGGSRPDGSTREFTPAGAYLFAAARGLRDQVADDYSRAIAEVLSSSSVWTNATDDGGAVHD